MVNQSAESLGELKEWERIPLWLKRVRVAVAHVEDTKEVLAEAKEHLARVVKGARQAKVPNKDIALALGKSDGRASQIAKEARRSA
jgi:nicotinic acid mononucleotide adenylyltransferase